MTKKCANCGKEFTIKNNSQKFCCEKCRKERFKSLKNETEKYKILECLSIDDVVRLARDMKISYGAYVSMMKV